MDRFLQNIQSFIFSIDSKLPSFSSLYKIGNRIQDFRTKHTMYIKIK